MAIVINGSGTVTGISVGGLPDGVVDAGTLATNSVDSAELIDGAIDNSHLADNAVGLAEMASGTDGNIISYDASGNPVAIATGNDGQVLTSAGAGAPPAFEAAAAGGKILQHRIYTFGNSSISTTSSSWQLVGSSFTFTPTSSSSQLIFTLQQVGFNDRSNTNNSWINLAITKDSTTVDDSTVVGAWKKGFGYATVDQYHDHSTVSSYYNNTSTSAITFRIYFNSNDNTRTCYFHHTSHDSNLLSWLSIAEIDSSITDGL